MNTRCISRAFWIAYVNITQVYLSSDDYTHTLVSYTPLFPPFQDSLKCNCSPKCFPHDSSLKLPPLTACKFLYDNAHLNKRLHLNLKIHLSRQVTSITNHEWTAWPQLVLLCRACIMVFILTVGFRRRSCPLPLFVSAFISNLFTMLASAHVLFLHTFISII